MHDLATRIDVVRRKIERATSAAGRAPNDVQLIAVSKKHPASLVRAAHACGLRDFGENYVQELVGKAEELADLEDIRWHLIGHLQTNKAKVVAKVAHNVHTLDNPRIIDELSHRAQLGKRVLGVYVEVNIGNEAQKAGCHPDETAGLVQLVKAAPGLSFLGLMTVGQLVDTADAARPSFVALRQLRDAVDPGAGLSMGMSSDFDVAIAEGANCVRVGSAIFGERS